MAQSDRKLRMRRLLRPDTGRIFICPMDHGFTVGPIAGLYDMADTVSRIAGTGVDAIVVHKGIVRAIEEKLVADPAMGLFVHLFGSTSVAPDPNDKNVVCTVKHAMSVGADAVSVHVNVGANTEARMLRDFAHVAEECDHLGVPLLAMMYARGPRMKDAFSEAFNAHCARIAYEVGADIVKVCYTGSVESFRRICESVDIPVVIAGGEKMESTRDVLQMVYDSLRAGGAGVAFGRNIFGAEDPKSMCRAIRAIVHEKESVDKAARLLS